MKKSFYDLSPEEKLTLTWEQIQLFAKYECAQRGIEIPLEPLERPTKIDPPTTEFFKVGYEGGYFSNREDAHAYADLQNKRNSSKSVGKYAFVSDSPYNSNKKVDSEFLYTKEEAEQFKGLLEKNGLLESEWKQYGEKLAKVEEVEREIFNAVEVLRFEQSRREHHQRQFDQYVDLANGDIAQAVVFFEKAFLSDNRSELDAEIIAEIIAKNKPTEESDDLPL